MDLFLRLAVALGIGLLIGLERGWRSREASEGQRIAGIRTFPLISLYGALSAVLAEEYGASVLAFALAGLAALVVGAQLLRSAPQQDYGITTSVASFLTFTLGAATAAGHLTASVAVAVVTAFLLGLKLEIHTWVRHVEKHELLATIKLLLISFVLLPVLPDEGFGPWEVLNPYRIWWFVVLITGIGFIGYFAMKLAGERFGVMLTGLVGGLASSTAVALSFARLGRDHARAKAILAAGVVLASTTMFPRILVEVAVVNPALLSRVAPAVLAMTLAAILATGWLWRRGRGDAAAHRVVALPNPFELVPALKFAAVLVLLMLASRAAVEWFGDKGVYGLALLSGAADVDAITLSLSQLARSGLEQDAAVRGIVFAAISNSIAKATLVTYIGGRPMGRAVAAAFAFVGATGLAALALQSVFAGV
ncbi:MAG: MgtC/SapB family protein [Thiohalomonadaceae bacterium]